MPVTASNFSYYLLLPPAWLAGLLAGLFALASWKLRWLTARGAISTFIVGFCIFWLGGGKAIVPLLTFFLSSSLLSKWSKARSRQQNADGDIHSEKGSTRDAGQVWANGGMAVAMILLHRLLVLRGLPPFRLEQFPTLFLAALATVNADTWATELGRLAGQTPRSLRDWKPITPGTSGAVSLAGTLATVAGAAVIPLSVYWFWPLNIAQFVCVCWAGILGSLIDSLLGASLQVQYRDLTSNELTERVEVGGRITKHVRGWLWLNNDWVNFFASLGGVLCAYYLLRQSHLM